ncbi:substrate-binding domain-containing protein [Kitasatospora sp. NPDC004745]|uniref:substrate-binding domain-containing protein n=1 Tax=Kitasatospora sp. NPDC004745 TaxID=3364019 RepID=UPI0036C498CE
MGTGGTGTDGRRGFLRLGAVLALPMAALAGCSRDRRPEQGADRSATAVPTASTRSAAPPADRGTVRLTSVTTVRDGGLYDVLLPEFEAQSGLKVRLTVTEEVGAAARAGQADVVLSHFGHRDVTGLVTDGLVQWPRTVLANLMCLAGPAADPAGVRGLADLAEAFRRIAAAGRPLVVNDIDGVRYLMRTVAAEAGLGESVFSDRGLATGAAVDEAAASGGYTLWGLTPFREYLREHPVDLVPLVLDDPLLQRVMVTAVVDPAKVAGVNEAGAKAFQDYLLQPRTQARIGTFRLPGLDGPVFVPAGRHNAGEFLPPDPAAPGGSTRTPGSGRGRASASPSARS